MDAPLIDAIGATLAIVQMTDLTDDEVHLIHEWRKVNHKTQQRMLELMRRLNAGIPIESLEKGAP